MTTKPDDAPVILDPEPPASVATLPDTETADPPAQPKPISEKDAAKAVYRYRGRGTISGVPARDLTVLDVERLTPDQLRAATVAAPGGKPLYDTV